MAKNNITSESIFFNNGYDFYTYYNKHNQSIEFYKEYELPENEDNFILTPFAAEVDWCACEDFHEILSEGKEFLNKKGLLQFLRVVDLIETYYYAKEEATLFVVENWIEKTNPFFNWKN